MKHIAYNGAHCGPCASGPAAGSAGATAATSRSCQCDVTAVTDVIIVWLIYINLVQALGSIRHFHSVRIAVGSNEETLHFLTYVQVAPMIGPMGQIWYIYRWLPVSGIHPTEFPTQFSAKCSTVDNCCTNRCTKCCTKCCLSVVRLKLHFLACAVAWGASSCSKRWTNMDASFKPNASLEQK